jgi:ribosomal protein L22
MEEKQTKEKIINEAEKEIAKEVKEIEEKVAEHKITQKEADKEIKEEVDKEVKEIEEKAIEDKANEKKIETKKENKPKKTEAIVNAKNLPISTKHSIAICNMIRNKEIDKAILLLEQAEQKKIPVPMRGEIPHRKGIMSGRYPINALGHFIKSLKVLKANALVNELELEKYRIFCKADLASRPYRRFGKGKFKRTHLTLKLIQPVKKVNKKQRDKK